MDYFNVPPERLLDIGIKAEENYNQPLQEKPSLSISTPWKQQTLISKLELNVKKIPKFHEPAHAKSQKWNLYFRLISTCVLVLVTEAI